ncbi:MAG: hypothetical protein QNK42_04895 [Pseudodonghicola sp.]|nr:hypothetical protein [Pseudodonghicola sp.]
MAVFTVTNSGWPEDPGLTFESAVESANARPGADTIRFEPGL